MQGGKYISFPFYTTTICFRITLYILTQLPVLNSSFLNRLFRTHVSIFWAFWVCSYSYFWLNSWSLDTLIWMVRVGVTSMCFLWNYNIVQIKIYEAQAVYAPHSASFVPSNLDMSVTLCMICIPPWPNMSQLIYFKIYIFGVNYAFSSIFVFVWILICHIVVSRLDCAVQDWCFFWLSTTILKTFRGVAIWDRVCQRWAVLWLLWVRWRWHNQLEPDSQLMFVCVCCFVLGYL
jgi:hypothetical protein